MSPRWGLEGIGLSLGYKHVAPLGLYWFIEWFQRLPCGVFGGGSLFLIW